MTKSFSEQEFDAWEVVFEAYRIRDVGLLFNQCKRLMVLQKRREDYLMKRLPTIEA